MGSSYQFSIKVDFPDSAVNLNWLTREIEAYNFSQSLEYMGSVGDVLTIWFVEALTGEEALSLNGLIARHRAEMPSGHTVFQIPTGETKWERFKSMVPFIYPLNKVPSAILCSNATFNGASDLQIEDIKDNCFIFSIKAIGRGDQLGPNGVEFDWSASI